MSERMTRFALISKHNYFAMKKGKPWFSKWCANTPLPKNSVKDFFGETEAERYRRYALARGDRILYMVHCTPKGIPNGD